MNCLTTSSVALVLRSWKADTYSCRCLMQIALSYKLLVTIYAFLE